MSGHPWLSANDYDILLLCVRFVDIMLYCSVTWVGCLWVQFVMTVSPQLDSFSKIEPSSILLGE